MTVGISDCIKEAIDSYLKRDYNVALIKLIPAISSTAKSKYPHLNSENQCKQFITDNLATIFKLSSLPPLADSGITLCNPVKNTNQLAEIDAKERLSLEEIFYLILYPLTIGLDFLDKIEFSEEENQFNGNGRIIVIPKVLIYGLISAIVNAPSNVSVLKPGILNQKDNLLLQSYFSIALFMELKNNTDFVDFFNKMKFQDQRVKFFIEQVRIDNQGFFMLAFYGLLVLPKELLLDKFSYEFTRLNEMINGIATKAESTYPSDDTGVQFVRHIRNAVAHGRIEFAPGVSVTFKDIKDKNKTTNSCEITIPLNKIGGLLTELQKIFNLYIKIQEILPT